MVVWLNIAARAASYGIAMAAVLASVATASEPLEPPDPTDPAVIERIDGFLQDELRDAGIPGLAVAIVADGKVVHVRGFGVADETGRPVTPDTPFQLASVSKAFTATAIMQLVARGDVELDAPVTTYLPWFRVGDGTASADITIRQLLTHTSGITRDPWAAASASDGDDGGALERRIRGLAATQLESLPGERYAYSNPNFEILGLVVQTVAGEPYDAYVERHIYQPLGMAHSHVLAADAFADGASEGFYRWYGLVTAPWRTAYPRATGPAGVTFSSAMDMARWALFQLGHAGESGVLSATDIEAMHERGVQYDERHWYGMGWVVGPLWETLADPPEEGPITDPVPDLVEHGGAWETAHTYVGLVPERDWGVVILANINDRTMSTRYYYTELGVLNILSGGDPLEPSLSEPPVVRFGKPLVMLLFLLQLATIPLTILVVRRARAGSRPHAAPIVALAGLALVVDAVVVYLLVVVAPAWFGVTTTQLFDAAPDVGPLMRVELVLAVVWAPVRTILLLLVLRAPRHRAALAAG